MFGSSPLPREIWDDMAAGSTMAVDIVALQDFASLEIAATLETEAGFVVSCAAAALVVASAAAIAGGDPQIAAALPDGAPQRCEIVMQLGHDCNFGAPVSQMLRMAGAVPRRAGAIDACSADLIAACLTDKTAALLHVVSYETSSTGMLGLAEMSAIAKRHHVPLIVDCAGQVDIRPFVGLGGDLYIQSAQKYLQGPTAGILAGSADLIAACRAHHGGIARPLKASREQ